MNTHILLWKGSVASWQPRSRRRQHISCARALITANQPVWTDAFACARPNSPQADRWT